MSHKSYPHYNDAIMGVIASQIPASRLFTQPFIQTQIKENIKALLHWPLCGDFTGDRWIPRTNGQLRGKCFRLMTSSWCIYQNFMVNAGFHNVWYLFIGFSKTRRYNIFFSPIQDDMHGAGLILYSTASHGIGHHALKNVEVGSPERQHNKTLL